MSDGTNVKLGFEGLMPKDGYWTSMAYYNGYDGFDWSDMEIITKHGLKVQGLDGDTGFWNVLHGDAECFTAGTYTNLPLSYGWMISSSPSETFNLKSGIFAAGDNTQLTAGFYAFNASGTLVGKAFVNLTNSPTTIHFANYGIIFKDVYAVKFTGYAFGLGSDELVMDNLQVHWNGPIPATTHGAFSHPHFHPHARPVVHAAPIQPFHDHDSSVHSGSPDALAFVHHGELTSLAAALGHADAGGGLTALFHLPQGDHFGT